MTSCAAPKAGPTQATACRPDQAVADRRHARQHQPHVDALRQQDGRQRADDVGQAAGLQEREDFRRRMQHSHQAVTPASRRAEPHSFSSIDARDQGDAVGAAMEARGVELGILADHQAIGNAAAVVDDRPGQAGMAADLDLGQQHRLSRPRAYEWTRQLENSSERFSAPEMMQPPDTVDSIAMPRRSPSLWTNLAGGSCSWKVQIGQSRS